MVRALLLVCLLLPGIALAEFLASVDRTEIKPGEVLQLTLTLTEEKAREEPDLTPLEASFEISYLGSSSESSWVNGKRSRSKIWRYRLQPKGVGKLTIPALEVATGVGPLTTQPVTIDVTQSPSGEHSTAPTQGAPDSPVAVVATLSKGTAYVRESLIYRVVITSYTRLRDAHLQTPEPDQAVFEQIGKAEEENRVIDGRVAVVTTLHYRLTPLASGELVLPPAAVEGRILDRSIRRSFDPFGTTGYIPLRVLSDALKLDVKPPQGEPWLPLSQLHIEERWDPAQTFRVGEPISRELALVAEGSDGAQLPPFVETDHADFRLYLDRPEFEGTLDEGGQILRGVRRERMTMIPRRAGTLELPAVRVRWWDVNRDAEAWAEFPARRIEVLPALTEVAGGSAEGKPAEAGAPDSASPTPTPLMTDQGSLFPLDWLGFGAGFLAGTLLTAAIWGLLWWRVRPPKLTGAPVEAESRKVFLKRLRQCSDPVKLNESLQAYAAENWGTPGQASPRVIAARAAHQFGSEGGGRLGELLAQLEQALYGDRGNFDGSAWGRQMQTWLNQYDQPRSARQADLLAPLNPGIS
ncbi:MAG: BatD family protein [Gammaproteobacteria bacterium]|nr:BatD family protein [Gammaproteobacteria bacterium]